MLHGHAKIELTNVKTGKTNVIEHDNYMTNWLKDVLTPDMLGNNILNTVSWNNKPEFSKAMLFGGVILFEQVLTDNAPNDYLFPVGNKMVAHGWDETYGGTDLTAGSFNSGLSEIADDHATFVWDWTQERGNGTISALGLTNIYGGKIGNGHGDTAADVNVALSLFKRQIWQSTSGNLFQFLLFDAANNLACFIRNSLQTGNKIEYRRCAFQHTAYNPITESISWDDVGLYSNGELKQIDVSSYFSSFPAFCFNGSTMYMCAASDWASGSRTFVAYNFVTETLSTFAVSNNTGKTIKLSGGGHLMEYWDGHLYFATSDSKRVYIDLTDNTDCGTIKNQSNEDIAITTGTGEYYAAWGYLFFADANAVNQNATQLWCMTDKNHASRRNAQGLETLTDGSRPCYGGDSVHAYYMGWRSYYTESMPNIIYNMMALQTKNNLQTPVVKNSDMTMRVTYTIREVSE